MFKNVIGLALSVGGAIIGGKIISNLADKNPKTKEIKEKVVQSLFLCDWIK